MNWPGHNGGPPVEPLTPTTKLEHIQDIVSRRDLTAAQKCIGVGIVLAAGRDRLASVRTHDLMLAASASDRATVFKATRHLQDVKLIHKESANGQAGRYAIMPARVVDAIVDAFTELKSSRAKPDGLPIEKQVDQTPPVAPEAVCSDPTGMAEPVGLNPTGQVKPDGSRPPAPARIETPSGLLTTEENNNPPSDTPKAEKHKRGKRLPLDWTLPDVWLQWSRVSYVNSSEADIRLEAEKFRDFWHAKAGKDAAKLDWEATWRNWCRNGLGTAKRAQFKPTAQGGVVPFKTAEIKPVAPLWWKGREIEARRLPRESWKHLISKFANGVWSYDMLGPGPCDVMCMLPESLIQEMGLRKLYGNDRIAKG